MSDSDDSQRLAAAQLWSEQALGRTLAPLQSASADASFRRYFRLRDGGESWILMDAPPELEPLQPFVAVAQLMEQWSLPAPRVIARDDAMGFLLLSDLGEHTLLDVLNGLNQGEDGTVDALYGQAIDWMLAMQSAGVRDTPPLAAYDAAAVKRELELFPQWYVAEHLGQPMDAEQLSIWQRVVDLICEHWKHQPVSFVHRDYHSRNLMARADANCLTGMLDFQDAVIGPMSYDLVSLIKDCYVVWPEPRRARWLAQWQRGAIERGLISAQAPVERWLDWAGLQRHLKVLGIFARLWHRDGKPGYLADLPVVLAYVREVTSRYPELAELDDLLARLPVPATAPR